VAGGRTRTAPEPRSATLAVRFARGDEEALADVVDEYGGPMMAVATRLLADRRVAEEAMQQALVQAWRSAGRYDPERPLGPWLLAIVRYAARDAWRRERRHNTRSLAEVAADDLPSIRPPGIDDAYDMWLVRRALDALPPGERDVVRLAHHEQLSHPEIAARLDVPVGTVKSRSSSAYRKLRTALAPALAPPPAYETSRRNWP
jgi:RNA polymerase sigma-70 factor, ECF subfamily